MPCEICNNNAARTYTHSRERRHLRKLIRVMQQRKAVSTEINNGVFLYDHCWRKKKKDDAKQE